MTKAERYKARLGGVLQQKLGVAKAEQKVRAEGPQFPRDKLDPDLGPFTKLYAVVGDGGGLLVVSGEELRDPAAIAAFVVWQKETFLDDDEEADAEKA